MNQSLSRKSSLAGHPAIDLVSMHQLVQAVIGHTAYNRLATASLAEKRSKD